MEYFRKDRWSPYLVGALIGGLLTVLMTMGYTIGVSSGIARVSALLHQAVAPVQEGSYFDRLLSDHVIFNWKIFFITGILLGAFVASKLTTEEIPKKNTIWENAFGTAKWKRNFAAFIGGFLLLFGARLANGCTSGHAISGGAQLSIISWVFMLALFASAIPVAFLLYQKKGGNNGI